MKDFKWMMGVGLVAVLALGCGDDGAGDNEPDTTTDTADDAGSDTDTTEPVQLAASYDLTSETLFPEGIAYDSVEGHFLLGSLSEATITSVSADGREAVFAVAQREDWMTLGLAADEDARVLWACARPVAADSGPAELWRFDLDTGDALDSAALSAAASDADCNDVTLGRAGGVFVSDPTTPRVFEVDAAGVATVFVADDVLAPQIPSLGPNGLVMTPDGTTLVVAVFSPPSFYAVPLDAPASVNKIELDTDPFAAGGPFAGPDGLLFFDGDLIAVTSGQVIAITLDAALETGVVSVAADGFTGLSTGTLAGGAVYVVKSDPVASVTGSAPDLPFQILRAIAAP